MAMKYVVSINDRAGPSLVNVLNFISGFNSQTQSCSRLISLHVSFAHSDWLSFSINFCYQSEAMGNGWYR